MTAIPVILVDDSDVDRYLLRRVLRNAGGFGPIRDYISGEDFLAGAFGLGPGPAFDPDSGPGSGPGGPPASEVPSKPASAELPAPPGLPPLVLMDINMPGRDGFDTIEAVPPPRPGMPPLLFVMCSASQHPRDHARAETLEAVAGFIAKPPTARDAAYLRRLHARHCARL